MSKGSITVKVNGDIGYFLKTRKGVRQGDSLSPIMFNIVFDKLVVLISRAKEAGQIQGVVPHLVAGELSVL
jgi:hypothetical protein